MQLWHSHTEVSIKTAMKFDVEKLFAETRRSAQEYTQTIAIALSGKADTFLVKKVVESGEVVSGGEEGGRLFH